jgi:hypothetical protein
MTMNASLCSPLQKIVHYNVNVIQPGRKSTNVELADPWKFEAQMITRTEIKLSDGKYNSTNETHSVDVVLRAPGS